MKFGLDASLRQGLSAFVTVHWGTTTDNSRESSSVKDEVPVLPGTLSSLVSLDCSRYRVDIFARLEHAH